MPLAVGGAGLEGKNVRRFEDNRTQRRSWCSSYGILPLGVLAEGIAQRIGKPFLDWVGAEGTAQAQNIDSAKKDPRQSPTTPVLVWDSNGNQHIERQAKRRSCCQD